MLCSGDFQPHKVFLSTAAHTKSSKQISPIVRSLLCRLDAPFGTAENPTEVTSEFDNRVVGVPDPDDDSLVWWGIIEEGSPPKQVNSLCPPLPAVHSRVLKRLMPT